MKIAIIGGTGKEGSGLAVRWANKGHRVYIGSRDAARGVERAKELSQEYDLTIHGGGNEEILAVDGLDLVVLSVPYSAHASTLESLKDQLANARLLEITVPLQPPKVPDGMWTSRTLGGCSGTVISDREFPAALYHRAATDGQRARSRDLIGQLRPS